MTKQELDALENVFIKVLQRPIAFHRAFVEMGGVAVAVMLSQALYWHDNRIAKERGGWFYKTRKEWYKETGLTRREQESSRKKLIKLGILQEELKGVPAKLWFNINITNIAKFFYSSWYESAQLVGTNPPNKVASDEPTIYTEITTKNTPIVNEDSFNNQSSELEPLKDLFNSRNARHQKKFGFTPVAGNPRQFYPEKKKRVYVDARGVV